MSLEPSDPPLPVRPAPGPEPAVDLVERLDLEQNRLRSPRAPRSLYRRTRLSIILFAATCLSTFLVGMNPGDLGGILSGPLQFVAAVIVAGRMPPGGWAIVQDGLVFGGCLMGILLAHEMGHFLQAVRHRVPATLPFFIPFPFTPFGTMGAVIVQDAGRANRRQLFDIAVSGPIAGLLIAVPVLWYGISLSHVETVPPGSFGVRYGDPLLVRWTVEAIHGPYGPDQDVMLNAPLFAGWVGIFITALNLLPVGQFDGGHILYVLIGRRAHVVAYAVLAAAVLWMAYTQRLHYALIVLLLFIFGPKHPPTADDSVSLGLARTILGWLTLAFIVVGFTPTPIMI